MQLVFRISTSYDNGILRMTLGALYIFGFVSSGSFYSFNAAKLESAWM